MGIVFSGCGELEKEHGVLLLLLISAGISQWALLSTFANVIMLIYLTLRASATQQLFQLHGPSWQHLSSVPHTLTVSELLATNFKTANRGIALVMVGHINCNGYIKKFLVNNLNRNRTGNSSLVNNGCLKKKKKKKTVMKLTKLPFPVSVVKCVCVCLRVHMRAYYCCVFFWSPCPSVLCLFGSSEPQSPLQPNLVWWCILTVINQNVII